VTEQEAARKLCALLNEIGAAGYEVATGPELIWVGETVISEPSFSDGQWEVRG
jgi:hypothetical protein